MEERKGGIALSSLPVPGSVHLPLFFLFPHQGAWYQTGGSRLQLGQRLRLLKPFM